MNDLDVQLAALQLESTWDLDELKPIVQVLNILHQLKAHLDYAVQVKDLDDAQHYSDEIKKVLAP